jgi:hypothetical protein
MPDGGTHIAPPTQLPHELVTPSMPRPAVNPRRYRDRRNYEERMADPVRAARWRAQKRQWWREHRAKWHFDCRSGRGVA